MKKLNKKILITGGGSGGHVSVATAFIDALKNHFEISKDDILYVGSDLGMVGEKNGVSVEQNRMKEKDINFTTLRAGKLQRRFELATIKLLLRAILGVVDAIKIVKAFKPDLIFSTGGYLSVPIAIAGLITKTPIYLHEQTAAVGMSNNFVAKIAKRIYISFKSSQKYFPKEKVLLTGNIVRPDIFRDNSSSELCTAVRQMKEEKLPIVYMSGGGQGSHILNLLVNDMLSYALMDYQIILQTGDNQVFRDYDVLTTAWRKLPTNLQRRLYITKFVSDSEIGCVFKHSDLYVGRAGANIVYEMGILKKPSIFIPIPWVTHNEQEKNARILEGYGLSKVILEGEVTSAKLHAEIKGFISEIPSLEINHEGLDTEFVKDAQERIIEDIFGNIS